MNAPVSSARASAIRRRLLRWWSAAKRDLPWRFPPGRADPYRVWISEVMLQQTQVATVIPYYRRFLGRFPTLAALAGAREEEVLGLWAGLGYYARGRALLRAAREAMARHGALPRTVEELRRLPGFGPYTAGAVASIAFGVPTPAVDGNASRVLARLFVVGSDPHGSTFRKGTWAAAAALLGAVRRTAREGLEHPGELNQALIELGALVCRPAPRCERCPLEPLCGARAVGREGSLPAVRRRTAQRRLRLAVAICEMGGRVLLVRRPEGGLFGGMWSPPTVELTAGEDTGAAISREIEREPCAITDGFTLVGTVERTLTHRRLELVVLTGALAQRPKSTGGWKLAAAGELEALAIPAAMRHAMALAGWGGAARRSGGARSSK